MSSNRGVRSVARCQVHVDELECAANNCRLTPVDSVPARQRRGARRAAMYRNQIAMNRGPTAPRVPLPVPVRVTQTPQRPDFKLPSGQVWVKKTPTPWAAKSVDADDAIKFSTLFNGVSEINDNTKIFRVLVGFVANSDGTFAFVRNVGSEIPALPVVGRVGFVKQTYRSRDINLGGQTAAECRDHAFMWSLNEHRRDADRVLPADFWFAISKPASLMPPDDFLVNSQ